MVRGIQEFTVIATRLVVKMLLEVRGQMFYNGWGCIIAPFFGVLYNHCYALGEIETKKKGEGENFRVPKTKYN
jgi:hypothetical protein